MQVCKTHRPVDCLQEEELGRLKEMSIHNDIGVVAAMYHCAQEGVCPPPWLVQSSAEMMIKLLTREISPQRGRSGGRIARYRQDLIDFERWNSVLEVRRVREENRHDLKAFETFSPEQKKEFRHIEKVRDWLRHGTYECASMSLRRGYAFAGPDGVKASYFKVQKAMRSRSTALRYHLTFNDFVFRIGLDWPGAVTAGTKFVPFYNLTP